MAKVADAFADGDLIAEAARAIKPNAVASIAQEQRACIFAVYTILS